MHKERAARKIDLKILPLSAQTRCKQSAYSMDSGHYRKDNARESLEELSEPVKLVCDGKGRQRFAGEKETNRTAKVLVAKENVDAGESSKKSPNPFELFCGSGGEERSVPTKHTTDNFLITGGKTIIVMSFVESLPPVDLVCGGDKG